jgi:Domain of unknown function (DUF4345)
LKNQIILLRAAAVAFDLFGLAYFFMPIQMSALLGAQLTQPGAVGDVRAVYGGLSFGLSILFWLCANPAEARTGLKALLLTCGGLAVGRLVGLVLDGMPAPFGLALLGVEAAGVVLAMLALRSASVPVVARAA